MTTSGAADTSGFSHTPGADAYDYKPSTAAFPPVTAPNQFNPAGVNTGYLVTTNGGGNGYAINTVEDNNSWAVWSFGLALVGAVAVISLGYAYVGIALAVLGAFAGFAGLVKGVAMHSGKPRFGRSMAGLFLSMIVFFLGVVLMLVVDQI